jgi:hypothetical protein
MLAAYKFRTNVGSMFAGASASVIVTFRGEKIQELLFVGYVWLTTGPGLACAPYIFPDPAS